MKRQDVLSKTPLRQQLLTNSHVRQPQDRPGSEREKIFASQLPCATIHVIQQETASMPVLSLDEQKVGNTENSRHASLSLSANRWREGNHGGSPTSTLLHDFGPFESHMSTPWQQLHGSHSRTATRTGYVTNATVETSTRQLHVGPTGSDIHGSDKHSQGKRSMTVNQAQQDPYVPNDMNNYAAVAKSPASSSRFSARLYPTTPSTPSSSPRSLSSSPSSLLHPLPQKLDPARSTKYKTELCVHYQRGTLCPFGSKCNYAHGENELRFTKLYELEEHGFTPCARLYRSHPCFSYVMTGSCPFGSRCNSIHDFRVGSPCYSWLPHTDLPVNNLPTTTNIDRKYHERKRFLDQANPLIHPFTASASNDTDFEATYGRVCNMSNVSTWSPPQSTSATQKKISELQRLQMAGHFLRNKPPPTSKGKPLDGPSAVSHSPWNYVFSPKHLIYSELCMILQTRYFRLLPSENSVEEISGEDFHAYRTPWTNKCSPAVPYSPKDVIVVYSIAFGPIGDGVRPVSLWFDIGHGNVMPCSIQQQKRYKRRKAKSAGTPKHLRREKSANSFDRTHHRPFFFSQPVDDAAYELMVNVLIHRMHVLRRLSITSTPIMDSLAAQNPCVNCRRSPEFEALVEKARELKENFLSLTHHWKKWAWPVNVGREMYDRTTNIPGVNVSYRFAKESKEDHESYTASVWTSFTETMTCTNVSKAAWRRGNRHRLDIFTSLSCGMPQSAGSGKLGIPTIRNDSVHDSKRVGCHTATRENEEEWEAILLNQGDDNKNEWDIIQNHYLWQSKEEMLESAASPPLNENSPYMNQNVPFQRFNNDHGRDAPAFWTRMPGLQSASTSSESD